MGVGLLNDHISKKYEELTEEEIEAMIAGKFGELGEHVEENLKDCMEEVSFDDRLRYPLCA